MANAKFERLYNQVSEEILQGHYRPGDRISIKDLALRLKVSPTPIREILSRLVGRGIVEERRSEGYYLARLDAQDIVDFLRQHERCMLLAVKKARTKLGALKASDPWSLFADIARATGDNAIVEMRALLAERLAVIRQLDGLLVADSPTDEAPLRSQALADERSLILFIKQFHALRVAAASSLALHLVRAARI